MAGQVKRRRAKQPTPQQTRIEAARGRHPYDRLDEETLYRIEQFRVLSYHVQRHVSQGGNPIDIWPLAPPTPAPDERSQLAKDAQALDWVADAEICDRLISQLRETRLPDVHRRYVLGLLIERYLPPDLKPLLRKELQMDCYGRTEIGAPGAVEKARWYMSQHPDAGQREIARFAGVDHHTVGRWEKELFADLFKKPEE
jgi:hypothetical protein